MVSARVFPLSGPAKTTTRTAMDARFRNMNINDSVVLRTDGLTKKVSSPEGELTILKDITFEVAAAETLAIIGVSGAGKSTLLALMAGLDEPSAGHVWLNGIDLTSLKEDGRAALRNEQVGFVFQSFHLLPALTALENVLLPLELSGREGARAAATDALDQVGLQNRRGHYPRQLSGGEKQRVAIARAFVTEPTILFADEPTGNLDARTGARVMDLLFDLNSATGTTLVLVTHDERTAARCHRTIELAAGRLVASRVNLGRPTADAQASRQ